ncbi:MAG: MarR family winged helix-turn-helix transcriptional regulator [Peptococcales bacterium]
MRKTNIYEEKSLNQIFVKVKHRHFTRAVGLYEEIGLFIGQPPILFELIKEDGLTQKELAERRNLSPATITVTLKRMEKAGWITRRADTEDSRVSRVFLTEKAMNIQNLLKEKQQQMEEETFKNFTDIEKVLLRRFLLQIWENLGESVGTNYK